MTEKTVISLKPQTLLQAYDQDNERFHMRVGRDRSQSTYQKLIQGRNYVAEFLCEWYFQTDIPLSDLSPQFINDFAAWLGASKCLHNGTVWLACQLLKGVVTRASQRGLLHSNPFSSFRIAKNIRPREYLTEAEIRLLINQSFKKRQHAFARDLFVFSCFTGLAFVDMQHLKSADIVCIDGQSWICSRRYKTGVPYQVRLLSIPLAVIYRYLPFQEDGFVFGRMEYRTMAKRLEKVMEVCDIRKHITFHCARHSFAVMALNQGMPIESVSRVLGHTNITTTQIYAKITMKKLNRDFDLLEQGCMQSP